jgi:hypothetical protein
MWKLIYISPVAYACDACIMRINFFRGMLMEIYLKYIVKVIENDYMPKSIQKYLGG